MAMLPKGPVWTRTGVFSVVCRRFGMRASLRMTAIAPAAWRSSAVTGRPSWVKPTTIRPRRPRRSASEDDRASTAMTSLAAVMSNPDWRGTPSIRAPRPSTMPRSARSLTSSTRRHEMLRGSMPRSLP